MSDHTFAKARAQSICVIGGRCLPPRDGTKSLCELIKKLVVVIALDDERLCVLDISVGDAACTLSCE